MPPVQHAVVAYIQHPIGELVEALRRELHPPHAHLPAHLTVLPPRLLPGSEEDALETLRAQCQDVAPFEVGMGDVETFIPATPTVFVRVAHGAYRMRELHDRLNIGPLWAREQWPYMPHLTIVKMETQQEAEAVGAIARERWAQYHGGRRVLIGELTFVRQTGVNQWLDLAPVPLGTRLQPAIR